MAGLRPLSLPRLSSGATAAAFGAGRTLESFGGGAGSEAYGGGRIAPQQPIIGSPTGRALEQLGQTGERAADALFTVQRRQDYIGQTKDNLANRNEWQQTFLKAQADAPYDAHDFTKNTLAAFDEFAKQKTQGLEGVRKDLAEQDLAELRNSITNEATRFEAQRKFEAAKNDLGSTIDVARNAVFSRPQDHEAVLGGLVNTINSSSLPDFAKAELVKSATAATADSYFQAQAIKDPYGTREILQNGDEKALRGLDPDHRLRLLGETNSQIRQNEAIQRQQEAEARAEQPQREAEARAAQQEAQYYARFTAQDALSLAEHTGKIDPNAVKEIHAAFGDKAEPMLAAIRNASETFGVKSALGVLPPEGIAAAIQGLTPAGTAGFENAAKNQDQAVAAARQVLQQRQERPAEAVVQNFPTIAAGFASRDPGDVAKAIRGAAQVQSDIFKLPPEQQQLLPDQVRDAAITDFKNATTSDTRLAVLNRLVGGLDDPTANKVLSELEAKGMEPEARYALEQARDGNINGAKNILAGLTVDPAKQPKVGDAKAADVDKAIDAVMADPTQLAGLSTHVGNMVRDPGLLNRSTADRAVLRRLSMQYANSGMDPQQAVAKAQADAFGDKQVVGNDDVGYVTAPPNVDPSEMSGAMARVRQSIDLSHYTPVMDPAATGADKGAQNIAMRRVEEWKQRIRDGGMFVDAPGGYALMSPSGPDGRHAFVADPKNPSKPLIFTPQQILEMGKGTPPAPAQMGSPMPADPWSGTNLYDGVPGAQ